MSVSPESQYTADIVRRVRDFKQNLSLSVIDNDIKEKKLNPEKVWRELIANNLISPLPEEISLEKYKISLYDA